MMIISVMFAGLTFFSWSGCEKEAPPPAVQPREAPVFESPAPAAERGTDTQPSVHGAAAPAHPGMTSPHRPAAAPTTTGPAGASDGNLKFTAPEGWVSKPARAMISQLYTLPKVEGDSDDAEVTVSSLGTLVPLQMNINRWCGQFGLTEGTTCADAVKKRSQEGTSHPTTIVELSGAYRDTMRPGPNKPGFKMIAAEIVAGNRPWYVKMVGPEKTVAKWEEAFLKFVREAK